MSSNLHRSPVVKKNIPDGDEPSVKYEYEDGRSYDPAAVQVITQNWIEEHMKRREGEFTESVASIIFCGTWNVNNKMIKEEGGLRDWLCPINSVYVDANGIPIADVYVVGFQEMVDLSVVNVAMDNKSQQRSLNWQEKIAECLESKGGKYTQVFAKHLVGLLICVFVKQTSLHHIRDVRGATAGVGVMGMMGNKGGASIRLTLFDSSLCFVCSHLAAHRENVVGRNNDFKSIIEKTVYIPNESSMEQDDLKVEKSRRLRYGTGLSEKEDLTILQHDIIFWLGDLNYRIDDSLTTEEVFQRIEKKDISSLREKDQLNIEREKGNAFNDFNEGIIEFYPTYKYQPGTDDYETRPEKKLRAPAWCDRVLWKCEPQTVQQLTYDRSELRPSDHKPVMSLFSVRLRKIVADKERAVFQELIKILDKNENDDIPKVEVDGSYVDFGCLKYLEKVSLCIKIRNVGSNAAPWRFVPKLDDKYPCKQWITLTPSMGIILPNQETTVTISANIDTFTADQLNTAKETLEDIIILRIEKGRDFYISARASYARSCFGMSLDQLVCAYQPVRSYPLPATSDEVFPIEQISDDKAKLSIPKELWRLIDALWQSGMDEADLFAMSADQAEVAAVREALDTGAEFSPCSAHAIAHTVTAFLSSLPSPLLPADILPSLSDVEPNVLRIWCRRFLEHLPPISYNVFVYLLSFERELLLHKDSNNLTPAKLASINVSCMTSQVIKKDENDEVNSALEAKLAAGIEALQVVIVHMLTSSVI